VHQEIGCELSEATSPSSRAPTRSYRLCPATPPVSERYHRGACRGLQPTSSPLLGHRGGFLTMSPEAALKRNFQPAI
jgi:hypothetical protein